MSREEGRKRNGTAQQEGRKGRGSDRAARLHRSDYRATIIANGHVRLRGEKKRERKEKKEKKGGNIRQLREFEFRLRKSPRYRGS